MKIGKTPSEIARTLGRNRSTITREIKRGSVQQVSPPHHKEPYVMKYFSDCGVRVYQENRNNCGAKLKIGQDILAAEFIDNLILVGKFSPDVVAHKLSSASSFDLTLSAKTIYNYIDLGLIKTKNIDLLLKVRRNNKSTKTRENKRVFGRSIAERPANVNDRSECFHWEIDTVVGQRSGSSSVLLTLNERTTNFEIVRKINAKTAADVLNEMHKISKQFGNRFENIFKSITADNGSEFSSLSELENNFQTKVYFTHPYSSWERGANEHANGIIRRFIPKGKNIDECPLELIEFVENWCNHLPRKKHNYKTAQELFNEQLDLANLAS